MNGEEKKIEEVAMDGWELTSVPLLSAYFCEQAKHSSQYCAISTKPTGDKEKECTMQQIENAKVLANVISAALCWLSFAKDHLDEPDDVCPLAIKNAIACLQEGIDTCESQAQGSSSPSVDVMSNYEYSFKYINTSTGEMTGMSGKHYPTLQEAKESTIVFRGEKAVFFSRNVGVWKKVVDA